MGVVQGKVSFHASVTPFQLFLNYCYAHAITPNGADPELEFIDTPFIPDLRVIRDDGMEIRGQGCCIIGFKDDGYEIIIVGVPYPFYAEEFPHHCKAYNEHFKA